MSDSSQNGREPGTGRFLAGNRFGRGNPHLARLAEAQAEARASATPGAVTELLAKLHAMAMAGDVAAAKVWLDRVLGRAESPPLELHMSGNVDLPVGPPIPPTTDLLKEIRALHGLAEEFLGEGLPGSASSRTPANGSASSGALDDAPPTEPRRPPAR